MPVNAINSINPSFTGRGDNISAFVNLDDDSIRQLAYAKASKNIDYKRYKRQNAVLDFALPIAGGLSAAAFAQKGSRLAHFGAGFGSWTLFLAGMGAIFGLENAVMRKSEKANDFRERHPFMFFVGSAIAAFVAGDAAMKYGIKGVEKIVGTKGYASFAKGAKGFMDSVMAKSFVSTPVNFVKDKISKTPSAIKEAMKFAAQWSPVAVIFGSLAHDVKVNNKINSEYYNSYADLKEKQLLFAQYKLNEMDKQSA